MPAQITCVSGADLAPGPFLARWRCKREIERTNSKAAAKLAKNGHAKLHVLSIDEQDYGFVAMGIYRFPQQKLHYLQVLYLFVSEPYRKQRLEALEGLSASEYLMSHLIAKSLDIASFLPLTAIVLEPASDKLIPLYTSLDFVPVPNVPNFMAFFLTEEQTV